MLSLIFLFYAYLLLEGLTLTQIAGPTSSHIEDYGWIAEKGDMTNFYEAFQYFSVDGFKAIFSLPPYLLTS